MLNLTKDQFNAVRRLKAKSNSREGDMPIEDAIELAEICGRVQVTHPKYKSELELVLLLLKCKTGQPCPYSPAFFRNGGEVKIGDAYDRDRALMDFRNRAREIIGEDLTKETFVNLAFEFTTLEHYRLILDALYNTYVIHNDIYDQEQLEPLGA